MASATERFLDPGFTFPSSDQPAGLELSGSRGLAYISHAGNCDLILTPVGDVVDSVGPRKITINKQYYLITVGRSSRNKTKNLLPDSSNAYFDSPVMSRLHAWLKCSDDGSVLICDARSMHGTYVNDKRLEPAQFYPLETGFTIRFGNSVTRGSETFHPKQFTLEIIQKERMSEVQHGYGITSDELVLPDSPYSSDDDDEEEDDDDEIMITDVKVINKPNLKLKHGPDESPLGGSVTIVGETVRDASCVILDGPSIICDTSHVDLTEEPPMQQTKPPIPRISISELVAQERKELSRRSPPPANSEAPARHTITLDSDDEDGDWEPTFEEDSSGSDQGCSTGSALTSPTSTESSERSKVSLSLPDVRTANSPVRDTALGRIPVDEVVTPEVKQAWTCGAWKSPILFNFAQSTATSMPTPDTMEQVCKAEALRDRAHEFLQSRIELQKLRSLCTPAQNTDSNAVYPTPQSNQGPNKVDSTIPFWVRAFGQGANVESGPNTAAENVVDHPVTVESPCEGRGISEEHSDDDMSDSPAETRSPSPERKMAGYFIMTDDEDDEEFDPETQLDDCFDFGCSSDSDSSEDQENSEADYDDYMEGSCIFEISSVEGELMDYEKGYEKESFEDHREGTESRCSEDEALPPAENEFQRSQTVKNAMSMENFFSPNDEVVDTSKTIISSQSIWCEKESIPTAFVDVALDATADETPGQALIGSAFVNNEASGVDPDMAPPANKKRKRPSSAGVESRVDTPTYLAVEDIPPSRKIAPLPRRHLVAPATGAISTPIANITPHATEELGELPDVDLELDGATETANLGPDKKKARIENAGTSWGSTLATAIAGALVGGVGVFAALVATAGDM
ncbi:hypothetical protein DRE_00172 [Drechslerella stenobrocha 248]|uniref:FHA domain-containing protein n=1 Tax=Drechslerella stenobrocha 248 TaxID=1043628 RepID=W7I9U5_9PEZI|nr:hypothetical protein DRE_00172 [Drechslerella stenobrocha 248]